MEPENKNFKNAQDRFIDTIKFLEARAQEINFFQGYVKNKTANPKKLAIQKLPKHMRRRAMSHNRYRIPSRVRKIAKEGFTKTVNTPRKFTPRKTARRFLFKSRSDLITLWEYNANHKQRVLEHHRYLAKRMKMRLYGGIRIAWKSNTKCFKTAYKFGYNNCTITDRSYYRYIEIYDTEDKLEAIEGHLRTFQTSCIIIDRENGCLKSLSDPLLSDDIKEILEAHFDINVVYRDNYLQMENFSVSQAMGTALVYFNLFNCFELLGNQTLAVLKRFIGRYSDDIDTKFFSRDISLSSFPKDYRDCFLLRYSKDKISKAPHAKPQDEPEEVFEQRIAEFYGFLMSYKPTRGFFDNVIDSTAKIVNKAGEIKKDMINSMAIDEDHIGATESSKRNYNRNRPSLNITNIYENDPLPLAVMNRSTDKISRLIVITPPSTGNFILSNLQKAGALLIGKKEQDFVDSQHNQLIYPRSYSNTLGFKAYWLNKSAAAEKKFIMRNLKFNYIENSFPYPFYGYLAKSLQSSNTPDPNQLCSFITLCKGSVKKAALVFEPRPEDLACLAKVFVKETDFLAKALNKQGILGFDLKEAGVSCPDMEFDNIVEYKSKLETSCTPMRKVVGQVLHSHFNYLIERPKGVLYANSTCIDTMRKDQLTILKGINNEHLLKANEVLLLARNTEGFRYFFIRASRL